MMCYVPVSFCMITASGFPREDPSSVTRYPTEKMVSPPRDPWISNQSTALPPPHKDPKLKVGT